MINYNNILLKKGDLFVREKMYPNRNNIIQDAAKEKLVRISETLLAKEYSKLDTDFEQAMAEEDFSWEIESWPNY